jgi:hypothetical protein
MEGHEGLDDLERYLETAEVLSREALRVGVGEQPGSHPDKQAVVLAGGVKVMAKPGQGDPWRAMIRREAAGWQVARHLDCPGLVAATVLRDIPHRGTGVDTLHSLQITWPDDRDWCPSLDRFSEEEVWFAAVFDGIVAHTDRANNNWFGVPSEASGARQYLRLLDTGNAFRTDTSEPSSAFYSHHRGEELPDYVLERVRRLHENWPSVLVELLGDDEDGKTRERARRVLEREKLLVAEQE